MSARIIGVDVSPWQGICDWQSMHNAKIRFASIKACHGTGSARCFEENWRAAKGAMPRGAYVWLTDESPVAQAEAVMRRLDALRDLGEFAVMIDVEEPSSTLRGRALAEHVYLCGDRLEALTGMTPIIYSGAWYLDARLQPADLAEVVRRFPYCHAQYPRVVLANRRACATNPPELPPPTLPKAYAALGVAPLVRQFDGDGGCLLPDGTDSDFDEFLGSEDDFGVFVGAPSRVGPREVPRADAGTDATLTLAAQEEASR